MINNDDAVMTSEIATSEALTRGDGIAVWRRIADWIKSEIAAGRLVAEARLPSEAEFAEKFDVNRHTVRRALAALAEEGIVRSAQGRGTFVEPGRIPYAIGTRTRFTEILAAEGHVAGGELVDATPMPAGPAIAARLAIGEGDPVLCVGIRRLVDGVRISASTNYFPLPRFSAFAEAFRRAGNVTSALAACGVADYHRLQTRITARAASAIEALDLGLAGDAILLATESVNVDPDRVPIQLTEACFPADRIELVIDSAIAKAGR